MVVPYVQGSVGLSEVLILLSNLSAQGQKQGWNNWGQIKQRNGRGGESKTGLRPLTVESIRKQLERIWVVP